MRSASTLPEAPPFFSLALSCQYSSSPLSASSSLETKVQTNFVFVTDFPPKQRPQYQFIEPRSMSDSVKTAIQRDWLVTPSFQVNCVVALPDAVLYGTIGPHSLFCQPARVPNDVHFAATPDPYTPSNYHLTIDVVGQAGQRFRCECSVPTSQ